MQRNSGVAHICHPSTQKIETGGSGVQAHPSVYIKFETSLGYATDSQNKKNKNQAYAMKLQRQL